MENRQIPVNNSEKYWIIQKPFIALIILNYFERFRVTKFIEQKAFTV